MLIKNSPLSNKCYGTRDEDLKIPFIVQTITRKLIKCCAYHKLFKGFRADRPQPRVQVDEPLGHDLERGARDLGGSRGRGRGGVGDGGVNHHGGRSRGVQQAHGGAFEDNHHSTSLSLTLQDHRH